MDNVTFLADLIDDLNAEQLTMLLNWLAIAPPITPSKFRADIKRWRELHGLKV